MDYIIRDIKKELSHYLAQIMEIEKSSFPSPWSPGAFEGEKENSVSNLWAVMAEQMLAGYTCFWMFDTEIHVINFAIHSEKRAQGLGKMLLESVIKKGLDAKVDSVWLEVRPSNAAAIFLYAKAGFKEAGRRVNYYSETNEDAIVMSLDLTMKVTPFPGGKG